MSGKLIELRDTSCSLVQNPRHFRIGLGQMGREQVYYFLFDYCIFLELVLLAHLIRRLKAIE